MQKLKEFKIDGKIGGAADKPDTIQRFSSLKCQIDRAIKQDVSESTIIAAVLKAIPPNTKLRTFLENKTDLSVNEMLDYLKSHFHEQNYMLAFRELGDSVQDDKETAYDYVLGVFGMRDDVRNLAKKQGVTFDELLLRETTLNVIDTGLKNANIRYELKELTTFHPNKAIMDQVFLDAVSAAMDREQIRLKKRGEKKNRNLEVQSVQRQEKSERQEVNKRDGAVQARLAKQDKDIEGLSADVSEVKTLLHDLVGDRKAGSDNRNNDGGRHNNNTCCNHRCSDGDGDGHQDGGGRNRGRGGRGGYRNDGRNRNRRRYRCDQCINDNVARCVHCFICGSHAHRYADCPEKN